MADSLCVLLMLCSATVMTVTAYDWYYLENASGHVLDISRGRKGGRLIIDWKHGGDNQLWRWDWYDRLISKTGLAADIYQGNRNEGAAVVGWTRGYGKNQRWTFKNNYIYSRLNGLVMDVEGGWQVDGQEVNMYKWHGGSNQRWIPILYRPPAPPQAPDGDWFYLETSQGSVLHIPGGQIGRKLITYKKTGADSQLWAWGPKDWRGGRQLISKTGLACAVQRSDKSQGTHVISWTRQDGDNQRWKLEGNTIVSQLSGLAMDVEGGFSYNRYVPDKEVVMFRRHGKANQRWYVTYASWRSYIVSRMHGGRVLDIGSKVFYGPNKWRNYLPIEIRDSQPRRTTQLWHYDKRGRIVSESGRALKFEMFHIGGTTFYSPPGTPARAATYQVDILEDNEHWIYEDGLIKSSWNGLVLDVKGGRARSGTPVELGKVTRRSQQLWTLIPEKMIDNYKLMLENKNPSTEAFINKEMAEDCFWSVSGFPSLEEYKSFAKKSIVSINGAAEQLDKVAKDTAISDIVGSSLGIAGGILGGLLLLPFTGGMSMGMVAAGVGTAGTLTAFTSEFINNVWEKSEHSEVRHDFIMVMGATIRMHTFMNEYIEKLKAAHEYSRTAEGRQFLKDAGRVSSAWDEASRLGKPLGSVAWKLYKAKNYKHAKFLRDVWKVAVNINPSDMHALATRYKIRDAATLNSGNHAYHGKKAFQNTIGYVLDHMSEVGGNLGKAISGMSAAASIAFGVKGVVDGANKIKYGSDLADKCREMAKDLDEASKILVKAYKDLKQ